MARKKQKMDIDTQNDASFQYNDPFRILSAIERVDNAIQITSDVNVVLDNIITEVFHIFESDRAWLFYPCNPKVPSFNVSFESTSPLYPGAKSLQQKVPMTKDMADYCHRALSNIGDPQIDPQEGSAITNDIAIQFNAKSLIFMALQPQIGDPWMFGLHQCDHKRIWTDDDKKLFKIIGNRITNCIGNMLYLNRLKESELKFRSITEQTSDLISLTDKDGKITYASPSSKKLFGFKPYEMVGHHFTEYLIESEISAAVSAFRETITKGASTKRMELSMKHKNGSIFQGELTGSLFDSPNMRGTLVVIRDITDRKLVEKVLRESEKRFRDLADLLPEAVFEADMDMNLTFVNQKAYELTGYTKEDFEDGLNALDMLVPEERSRAREKIFKRIQAKDTSANEYLGLKKDGSTFPVLLNISPIVFKDENIGFRGILVDLTERNRIQRQLQQKQKMESIGSLAGGIAHDFNNILFPIIGMAELLLEDLPIGSLERENADEIFIAGKRGRDLVKQILTFSRQSDHPMAPTAFQNVVKEALKLSRATIPSNIDIRHDIQPDCGLILANPTQLHQVAMNIITNAYLSMP